MSHESSKTTATLPIHTTSVPAGPFKLRLWPGVLIVALMWLVRTVVGMMAFSPGHFFFGYMVTPMAATVLVCLWWLFASRLRWVDRQLVFAVFVVAAGATVFFSFKSFPFMAMILYCVPYILTAWVGWLLLSYRLSWPTRRAGLVALLVLGFLPYNFTRVDGMNGSFAAQFSPRWTPTPEERLLSSLSGSHTPADVPAGETAQPTEKLELSPGDWPGFRGANRDGRLSGVEIATDWDKSPPRELWRHLIGPGWSSFAVVGDHAYTQEQRGDDELVVCYDLNSGRELWAHHDTTRFTETVAGAGPRSTPTFDDGLVYALGANGVLNCLDATTGALQWSHDVIKDSGASVPQWGFSSSPLVAEGIVTVFAGGPKDKSVLGYQAKTGDLAWSAGKGTLSYCSPQLVQVDGVEQLLIATDAGLTSFKPDSGEVLWFHDWPSEGVVRVVQPALLGEADFLIGTGMGIGTRRIHVSHTADAWPTEELWTSKTIKPYYNDMVIEGDNFYGFDGNIFISGSLADAKVNWRHRGYGNGQVLLLADQHLLVVLTEEGEVALVEAQPDKHKELARFKAIEGKTWNHPVIAHGKLLIRNGEEVACFELAPLAAGVVGSRPEETDLR
jgi:outer membrane protein assembly factor BamB